MLEAHDSKPKLKPQKKSVGGDDIHRLIKEGFSVSGNDFLAYIHRVGDRRTVLRHKSQIDVNSIANPIGRIRKTHTLIASARRNHVVDGNTLVGIVNQRHREVSIRSVANSAVVAPRQCDLTLVIQQLNVQRQLETTLRHHHLRVINAKIRRNFIGFKNAIAKANFPRCANCFGLRASFTLRAIPLFLAKCYPCPFVTSVGISFLPRIFTDFTDLATRYACPFVASVGNVLFSHGFHRFSRIWLHVIRVHLCYQWGMFFFPTDFTDLHGFNYKLSLGIMLVGKIALVLYPLTFTQIDSSILSVLKLTSIPLCSLVSLRYVSNCKWNTSRISSTDLISIITRRSTSRSILN